MSWIDILKTKTAENVQDYWDYLAEITVSQDEEPNEGQIGKAMKLAEKYGFGKELEGHISGLLAVKYEEANRVEIEARKAKSLEDKQALPQAIKDLQELKGQVALQEQRVASLKRSIAYMANRSGDDENQYVYELARQQANLQASKRRFPQVFK